MNGSAGALDVMIRDLRVTFDVSGVFNGGTGHTLTIRNVDVEQSDQDTTDPAMSLAASVPATFVVTRHLFGIGSAESSGGGGGNQQ